MVKLSEFFKVIFGPPSERMGPDDIPRNIEEDFVREFGSRRVDEQIHMPFGGWWGFHPNERSPPGSDMGTSLFKEMEDMFNEFFRGFDSDVEFESPVPQFPPMLGSPESRIKSGQQDDSSISQSGSLRDRMLNRKSEDSEPNNSHKSEDIQEREVILPFHGPLSSWFSEMWRHPFQNSPREHGHNRADTDLDHELEQGKQSLDDILSQQGINHHIPSQAPRHSSLSSSFYSSTTVLGSDGIAESKTTRKDSDGNEEVTITRKLGDQTYKVTHRIDESGNEETREDLVNIDKDKLAEFEKNWSRSRTGAGSRQPHGPLSIDDGRPNESRPFSSLYDSILNHFFRR